MTMEISNRLPDTDEIHWEAIMMLGENEETFYLDLPPYLTTEEVQEAFIAEANDTYWLDFPPLILALRSVLGEF
jgi:hypothetical protein